MYLTFDQVSFFYRVWTVDQPQATLVIVHGLGEHSGRYERFARYFNACGVNVYAMDHRGHGGSDGKRGHINSFKHYGEDLHAFIRFVKAQNYGKHIHLVGYSMGGMIATAYAIRYGDVNSIILSSPGFRGKNPVSKFTIFWASFLVRFFPKMTVNTELNVDSISHSREVVDEFLNDPLVYRRISLRWFFAFLEETHFIRDHLPKMTLPCLLLLAESDLLADPVTTEEYFRGFASKNKVICRYPEAYHDIFHEVEERQQAFAEITHWLESH